MKNRILHVSGHEVLLNEVIKHSNDKIVFDYVLNKSGKEFRFSNEQEKSKIFYITGYDDNKFFWFISLLKILYYEKYRVVHFHISWPCALLFPFLLFSKSKFIVHSHTVSKNKGLISTLFKFFARTLINICSDINIACSKEAGIDVFKKFIIFHNPVDYERFKFSDSKRHIYRKKLNIDNNEKLCIHVGHYYPPKNQEFLINIFRDSRLKKVKLFCFGDDLGNKTELENLIAENKLKENIFLFNSKKDIENYLSASDIFLMPSLFEGLGIAAIEAQANGMPCILSNNIPKSAKISNLNNVSFSNLEAENWINLILNENKARSELLSLDFKHDSKSSSKVLIDIYKDLLCAV